MPKMHQHPSRNGGSLLLKGGKEGERTEGGEGRERKGGGNSPKSR